LNGIDFGVVGVLSPVALDPSLDNAAFVTQWAAKHELGTTGEPSKMYVRARSGTTRETSDALPTAINLGGTDSVTTRIPSDALEASARADSTLQQTALFAGLLALAVGGLGIANVMSISVIQRSSEIGIRRALGSTRSLIALQFLFEALFVGILGGVIGAFLGVGVVYLVSNLAGWVVVIDYGKMPIWIGLAVGVAVLAGLYPSVKAARLEPLETLRLG
jgi:putative ABC transport system permease protein